MLHPANVSVGVATHTGRVRRVNEDDFLLCAPQTIDEAERMGWIVAIADGQRPGAMMWTFLAIELGFAITSAMLLRHLADSGPQEELP